MIRETQTDPFVPTQGIHNLRDYGGWPVAGGGHVRRGLLWRSGHHVEATDADLDLFQALDVRTIIDFRGKTERTNFPCRRHPAFDAQIVCYDGETTSSPPHEGGREAFTMTAQRAYDRMIAVYTRMPVNPAMITMFSRFFDALDQRDGGSLIHCFAGKDRTGVAASLLLHTLGASHEDIVTEFLRTNDAPTTHILERQSLPRMREVYEGIETDAIDNLMKVRREYIETYFHVVEQSHGSIDAYLADTLGVDERKKARLKDRFIS